MLNALSSLSDIVVTSLKVSKMLTLEYSGTSVCITIKVNQNIINLNLDNIFPAI